jgi:hypothetical protein
VTDALSARFGPDRAGAEPALAREAAARLGARAWQGWPPGERLFWRRWAPLVSVLPGVERWSRGERAALVAAIRTKGSARESDAVPRLAAHVPMRRALARLMRPRDAARSR